MSMLARFAATGAGTLPTPTFVSSSSNSGNNTTSVTVTAPTGIQNGDLLVALTYTNSASAITAPTGFAQLSNEQAANPFIVLSVKTAGSESGNYTFTSSVSANFTACMLVYRNATQVNTIGAIGRVTSATATATTITPTYTGVLLAAFTSSNGGATVTTPPSGMTQRAAISGPPNVSIYDLSGQSATATGNKTLVWSPSATVSGVLLQVTNELPVAPEFIANATAQSTSGANSLTINKPTGTQEGDLMVLTASVGGNSPNMSSPSGWTTVADASETNPCTIIAYKVAGASEPSSYTVTTNKSQSMGGAIVVYRYAAYDTIAEAFNTTANPLVLTSISPSMSQSMLIAIAARSASGVTLTTPTSMTAKVVDADATGPSYIVCDQKVAKGPTGTRTTTVGSTSNVAGILLAIKPTRSL